MYDDGMSNLANFPNVDSCRIDGKPMLDEPMVNASSPGHSRVRRGGFQ